MGKQLQIKSFTEQEQIQNLTKQPDQREQLKYLLNGNHSKSTISHMILRGLNPKSYFEQRHHNDLIWSCFPCCLFSIYVFILIRVLWI
jgi:hypothetical protein